MNKKTIVFLIISVLILLYGCSSPADISNSGEKDDFQDKVIVGRDEKSFAGGTLSCQYDIPVLTVSGSYYDMGLQYGVLLKERLVESFNDFDDIYSKLKDSLPYYKRGLFTVGFINPIIRKTKNRLPQKYRDEIRGISDGSGIPERKLYLSAGGGGFLEFACSVVIQRDEEKILHGRVLDWYPGMGDSSVIVRYNPDNAHSYTTIGLLHYPTLGISGMGENKMSVSINLISYIKNKKNRDLPVYYITREILEKADSLNDVDELLDGYKSDIGWLLAVTDGGEGNGAIYEIAADDIHKMEMTDSADCIWGINGFKDDELNRKYTGILEKKAVINDPRWYRWNESINLDGLSVDYLIDILSDTSYEGYNPYFSDVAQGPINNSKSIQSLVFDNTEGAFYLACGAGFSGIENFYTYDIKTSRMTLYREKKEVFERVEKFRELNKDALINIITGNYDVIDSIGFEGDILPAEISMLYEMWERDETSLNSDLLLIRLDEAISKYPDVYVHYYMKAKILDDINRDNSEEMIDTIEKALNCRIIGVKQKIEMYEMLSECYRNKKMDKTAEYYSGICSDLINEFGKTYLK